MEKILPDSSWNLPPTDVQVNRINWYLKILGGELTEQNRPTNRVEARNLIHDLRISLKAKRRKK